MTLPGKSDLLLYVLPVYCVISVNDVKYAARMICLSQAGYLIQEGTTDTSLWEALIHGILSSCREREMLLDSFRLFVSQSLVASK